jgi:hypothetical protein
MKTKGCLFFPRSQDLLIFFGTTLVFYLLYLRRPSFIDNRLKIKVKFRHELYNVLNTIRYVNTYIYKSMRKYLTTLGVEQISFLNPFCTPCHVIFNPFSSIYFVLFAGFSKLPIYEILNVLKAPPCQIRFAEKQNG